MIGFRILVNFSRSSSHRLLDWPSCSPLFRTYTIRGPPWQLGAHSSTTLHPNVCSSTELVIRCHYVQESNEHVGVRSNSEKCPECYLARHRNEREHGLRFAGYTPGHRLPTNPMSSCSSLFSSSPMSASFGVFFSAAIDTPTDDELFPKVSLVVFPSIFFLYVSGT